MRIYTFTTLFVCVTFAQSQEVSFSERLGSVNVNEVVEVQIRDMPILTWGGDVPDILANGGVITTPNSIFGKYGLKYRLINGDNFVNQIRSYLEGKTPYLRGTFSMLSQANEVLNRYPDTKPVIVLQKTFSKGDYVVARDRIKTINDLKGTKGILQRDGPHFQLVDQMLKTANLTWNDIQVIWTNELTGANGSAAMFRNDESLDWCCAITPDMLGLVTPEGGVPGSDGTVIGAHSILSTNDTDYTIDDIVAVRSDFFHTHRAEVAKYVAGYLRSTEELLVAKKAYDNHKKDLFKYVKILKTVQGFYGDSILPNLDSDVNGLINSAHFSRLSNNISFFTNEFDVANWNWKVMAKLANIHYVEPNKKLHIKE